MSHRGIFNKTLYVYISRIAWVYDARHTSAAQIDKHQLSAQGTNTSTSTFVIRRRPRASTRTLAAERILELYVVPLIEFPNRQGRLPAESGRKRALQRLHHAPPPWRRPACRAGGRSGGQRGGAGIGCVEGGWGRLGGVGRWGGVSRAFCRRL